VDPAHASERRDTVVFISQHHHLLAGARACRRYDLGHDARASERDARIAVPARAPAAVPGLYWFGDQPVAENHSTGHIDQEAAGPPESMGFTLVGALFVIPFILAYTAMSYYVFRGKVRAGEGYH
jgi:hypothetical protein